MLWQYDRLAQRRLCNQHMQRICSVSVLGPALSVLVQGCAVSTKQMSWSDSSAERCDVLFAADILYDPGKALAIVPCSILVHDMFGSAGHANEL